MALVAAALLAVFFVAGAAFVAVALVAVFFVAGAAFVAVALVAVFFVAGAAFVAVALVAVFFVAGAAFVAAALVAACVEAGAAFVAAALVGAFFLAGAAFVAVAFEAGAAFATRAVVELRDGARLAAAVVLALAVSTMVPRPSLPQRSAVRARTGAARISAARCVLNGKTRNFRNTEAPWSHRGCGQGTSAASARRRRPAAEAVGRRRAQPDRGQPLLSAAASAGSTAVSSRSLSWSSM
ncbi:signal transduction histidine kinase [Phycicoccus sp. 3266]|nr:signal transduction histidine kinase [Phycicoccus sp. 3266]